MTAPRSATLEVVEPERETAPPDRLAHIVPRSTWPKALCGAIVRDYLGTRAPGRDRCPECLRRCALIGRTVTGYHDGPEAA